MLQDIWWAAKYRPKTISECILPAGLARDFQGIVDSGSLPNLCLAGPAGVGKTTVANALFDQLKYEWIELNGSGRDRGIDAVRGKVERFAHGMSMEGCRKAVLINEADNMTQDAQLALRAVIEETSKNCSYVLTVNYASRLEAALLSRCIQVDFLVPPDEAEALQAKFFKRCAEILRAEGKGFEPKALAMIVRSLFPDFRRTLGVLQKASASGEITEASIKSVTATGLDGLVRIVKAKDFQAAVEWVMQSAVSPIDVISYFTSNGGAIFADDNSWAQCFIDANEHDYRSSRVADQKINLVAFLLKVMSKCKFK